MQNKANIIPVTNHTRIVSISKSIIASVPFDSIWFNLNNQVLTVNFKQYKPEPRYITDQKLECLLFKT